MKAADAALKAYLLRTVQQLLDGTGAALWLRNLVRAAPPGAVEEALESLDRSVPRLRRGELWLGSAWPTLVTQIPFEDFARRLIGDARDILRAEQVILPRLGETRGRMAEEERVLGTGRDGALACGWIESNGALVYDSAFLIADMRPNAPNERMHRLSQTSGKLVKIDTAYLWAGSAGDVDAERGIEALNRMLS